MEITINARHGKLPDSLRNQANLRFSRFERIDRRLTSGALVIDGAARGYRAEARLIPAGGPPLISHAHASTLRAAIDGAFDRLERQLKRRRERRVARRTRGVAVAVRDEVIP
ncbi:MAG TPA: HPF/RaiA family ribosome-associated protein [Longimicrobiales bacterium]